MRACSQNESMNVEILAVTSYAEKLIEKAGRVCYKSDDKINDSSASGFIRMLIRSGHLSVLEHAYVTVRLKGVSRVFTHQIVRHRLCSFSQQSQRYVDEEKFSFVIPHKIEENEKAKEKFLGIMEEIRHSYSEILALGVSKEDARFVLPNACCSEIVFSCNFRELRHIFIIRGSKRAQWEIREVFIVLLKKMKDVAPDCFYDLSINEEKRIIEVKA